ncbi:MULTISPECIES: outer membrane beta-barrel protein [Salegentibacter]|uniref:Outer membrane protein beta-barrel domain-containing protein n=1 Tax=Salegentibacter agarivorans TaxID=345907 RepID=A0A1I2QA63_9FLAO|nr:MULTISPECIES: outer membrane beta-barrel protein [Salegentibacter]SFG24543.1 Outer membrane protein beta-barrel domain-containing protein [Salegentibacter agarivorans]
MKTNNIMGARKMVILKLVLILALISVGTQALAQSNNEVSFYLQGSFSELDYEALGANSELGNGFGIGAKYAYYISDNWSFGTGAEFQYMEGSIIIPTIQGAFMTQDLEGEEFEFRYQANNFSEKQEVYFLNIPLQIQYESQGMTRFYAAAGVKAGFVLDSKYKSKTLSLQTNGYYPQYDVELTDPEFAGFGEFDAVNGAKSDLNLKTNFVAQLESGIKLMLENSQSLYMGLFFDYGLNDIRPEASGERLIDYNNQDPTFFATGSLLASRSDMNPGQYVDEIRTLAFGLKIQYAFQF